MNYIPNGVIRVLSGVPMTPNTNHQLVFKQLSSQTSYFISKTKFAFESATFSRQKQTIRVPVNVEQIYDADYLMYQNNQLSNKWFYCFITDVSYVDTNTSEISFDIDEFQTWFFECKFKPTMVVRETVSDDTLYQNVEPEPISVETELHDIEEVINFASNSELMIVTQKKDYSLIGTEQDERFFVNGQIVYGEIIIFPYSLETFQNPNFKNLFLDAQTWVDGTKGQLDVWIAPKVVDGDIPPDGLNITGVDLNYKFNITRDFQLTRFIPDGTVKNNKCFISPFCSILLYSTDGNKCEIKPEQLNTPQQIKMLASYKITRNPEATCQILNYSTFTPQPFNPLQGVSMNNFLDGDLVISTAGQTLDYLANKTLSLAVQGIQSLLLMQKPASESVVTDEALRVHDEFYKQHPQLMQLKDKSEREANLQQRVLDARQRSYENEREFRQGASNFVGYALQDIGCFTTPAPQIQSPIVASSGSLYTSGAYGIFLFYMAPTLRSLQKLDDFFSKYGYAVNRFKELDFYTRENWNFIQTQDCAITGNLPANSKKVIQDMLNAGITLWHNPATYGDYQQPNQIN